MIRTLLILSILLVSAACAAQSPGRSKVKSAPAPTIDLARSLRTDDPAAAIRVLNALIQDRSGSGELAEVFVLLGDIYVDIEQPELALGRYAQAESLVAQAGEAAAELARKQGQAQFLLGNLTEARAEYEQCITVGPEKSTVTAACREGIADLEARASNYGLSLDYYSQAKRGTPDSSALSRINAKEANLYLQQNDLPRAANSLNEAIQQAPRGKTARNDEQEELLKANANVRGAVLRNAPDLDVKVVDVLPSAPAELLVADELARFRTLRELGQLRKAETTLENTLERVDDDTPAELAASVYAEGADFYLERNRPERAATVYREFTRSNEQLLAEERDAIDQQVAVLREQQQVDLDLRDLRAAAVESDLRQRQSDLRLWLNYLLGALLLGALLSVFLILRNVRKRRRVNQELLLRNLQTRMNPHFIFNSLNSINNYIARQDERSANRYLGRFAKLMRRVLDQSGKDFVPLSEELEQLRLYLELEKERFGEQFDYHITVAPDLPGGTDGIDIPPMILQPFVENAIWHGLRYRPEGGQLSVAVNATRSGPVVMVEDNGIGRKRSAQLKTDNQRRHRSAGLDTTQRRLGLINDHYGRNFRLVIADASSGRQFVGTRVTLHL